VIGMGRASETIDTAMLTPAIGIDRAVKADIGRVYTVYNGARVLYRDRCFACSFVFIRQAVPIFIRTLAGFRLITPCFITASTPSFFA